MKRKKWVKCGLLTLMMIGLSPLNVFADLGHVRVSVTMTCDKLKLQAGETATCGVSISSESVSSSSSNFSAIHGEIIASDGLEIETIASADNNYTLTSDGSKFILKANDPITVVNQELMEVKITARQDTKVEKANVQMKATLECTDWIKGDLTKDGVVDEEDSMAAAKIIGEATGGSEPTEEELLLGDMTGDGAITIEDVNEIDREAAREAQGNMSGREYVCFTIDQNRDGSTSTIEFEVTPAEEVVDVPDTASSIPVWYYVAGAIFMVFGAYLIVEARRKNQVQ